MFLWPFTRNKLFFLLLFWRFFNVQCRSSHSFCFVCLEHNLFKLRHTIIHELCFYCAFVQKHVTILDLRVMFSRNVSVNWGSVYYLYREMNKTSHHSCSNNKSDYLSLWQWQLTVSQAEFFASMHSGCKSFWRNCFYTLYMGNSQNKIIYCGNAQVFKCTKMFELALWLYRLAYLRNLRICFIEFYNVTCALHVRFSPISLIFICQSKNGITTCIGIFKWRRLIYDIGCINEIAATKFYLLSLKNN